MNRVLFSSNSDEWETPHSLFNILNDYFHFTLDPCSTELNHKCSNYFTLSENGLLQSWNGHTVFVNPPYSDISNWVKKCYVEWMYNNITVVLLIPARTDTRYFHDFIYHVADIFFIKGRLKFSNSKNSAPFPSMICVFNKRV